MAIHKILITAGEPAGIGPEIVVKLAQQNIPAQIIVCADEQLLLETAKSLNLSLKTKRFDVETDTQELHQAGTLWVLHQPLKQPAEAGKLNVSNAEYVIETLKTAAQLALTKRVDAILTGPIHKGIINQSGLKFSGHTEFFSAQSETFIQEPVNEVMMLATPGLRVCLATTHLPLSEVSAKITPQLLQQRLSVISQELTQKFNIAEPKIMVLGLNPHAGEDGHLGHEEMDIIIPTLNKLNRELSAELIGPIPADTAFKPNLLEEVDCVFAMYHDQGLPVLKHKGFGSAINITLGLPFLRTSVDHGTGLDIAGKNSADIGSMEYALKVTLEILSSKKSL